MPLSRKQSIGSYLELDESVGLDLLREDELHPLISGNKYRKLKYNIRAALAQGSPGILTYGGAFSNHILATAAACKEAGLQSVGVIRGEELGSKPLNPTLARAAKLGMRLCFISRALYTQKEDLDWTYWMQKLSLEEQTPFLVLPEGGSNAEAIRGCQEILEGQHAYDYVICAVGTGGTLAGLIKASGEQQHLIGISALPEDGINRLIRNFTSRTNWEVNFDYHGGGYARITPELVQFMNRFYQKSGIPLDPVYTAKMLWGIKDLVQKGRFSSQTRILAIHSGGLQGIRGMNQKLERKKWPKIQYTGPE